MNKKVYKVPVGYVDGIAIGCFDIKWIYCRNAQQLRINIFNKNVRAEELIKLKNIKPNEIALIMDQVVAMFRQLILAPSGTRRDSFIKQVGWHMNQATVQSIVFELNRCRRNIQTLEKRNRDWKARKTIGILDIYGKEIAEIMPEDREFFENIITNAIEERKRKRRKKWWQIWKKKSY